MEIAGWLQRLMPKVEAHGWGGECWVAQVKTRTPEHNPPLYWLGRAVDAVDAGGALDAVRAALIEAHGAATCEGWSEQDQRAQDVLTAACAFAWAAEHLGPPELAPAGDGDRLLVRVPSLDAHLAPRRLWPARTMEHLLQQVQRHAEGAAGDIERGPASILYLDVNLSLNAYARDVGYEIDLTEPVRASLKHHAAEQRLGWVLTRPFEWGVPLEAWY